MPWRGVVWCGVAWREVSRVRADMEPLSFAKIGDRACVKLVHGTDDVLT